MDDEKEEYKGRIIEMINSIDEINLLIYLNRLIENIIKAGK